MNEFFEDAARQNHPIRVLEEFLKKEKMNEESKNYNELRFVGYVFKISFNEVEIITSDPYKICVGGIPRNSLLIMVPANYNDFPPHFTLLRVQSTSPTPLEKEVQETYFELHKKSMPELDVFTQSELQWGALKTEILGMFYAHPEKDEKIEFSADINNFVSAHNYRIYAPNEELLDMILNSMVPDENKFSIGELRMTECRLPLPDKSLPEVPIEVSTNDFMGCRTAMFGKTRLGKSNVVKLIAQSLIETTSEDENVGQLIFDINGEYANDNPQDDNLSLRSAYEDRCIVYALTEKPDTPSKPLKLNFYDQPEESHRVIGGLLEGDKKDNSNYVNAFINVDLPSLKEIENMPHGGEKIRALRKIQIYWAILNKAGYDADENALLDIIPSTKNTYSFNPGISSDLREKAYQEIENKDAPDNPNSLYELRKELEVFEKFRKSGESIKSSSSGKDLFDQDDISLLKFLEPRVGSSGTSLIQPYRKYHDPSAGNFINEILGFLDNGKTIILDLGNANEKVKSYFSNELSISVFRHQVDKFTSNNLGNHYIQIYFEEAHNLFPRGEDVTDIYSRFAKEGAKYNIGMVYSTQSPTTINKDLLAQTENFFVAHLSSRKEADALAKLNVSYENLKEDILKAKTVGYVRMLTRSHRFVVPIQAYKFESK